MTISRMLLVNRAVLTRHTVQKVCANDRGMITCDDSQHKMTKLQGAEDDSIARAAEPGL